MSCECSHVGLRQVEDKKTLLILSKQICATQPIRGLALSISCTSVTVWYAICMPKKRGTRSGLLD
jgi:hypothetical protein